MVHIKVIDLFCGAGGFSEGFRQAGFEIIAGVDYDKASIETYNHNFKGVGILKEIQEIKKLPKADVIIGSPPCVPFSQASISVGLKTNDDSMVKEFFRIVDLIKPKYWILENVTNVKDHLPKRGRINILNSRYFGVPQNRERLFLTNFNLPLGFHSEEGTTVREALLNVHKLPNMETWNHKDETIKVLEKVRQNGSRYDNFKQSWKRLNLDELSPTVTDSHGYQFIHPFFNRLLSVREMARLQGFPDSFIFKGNRQQQYKQVGNAVSPPVAKAIAEVIKNE